MPTYDYKCTKCGEIEEKTHSIKIDPKYKCTKCSAKMSRMISCDNYIITSGLNGSLENFKESEHTKKVKDPERAVRSRKRAFGKDAVGDPSMSTDPRHIIKKGRTIGGQQKDIDKGEFIKAAAKDDYMVDQAIKALKK